MIWKIKFEDKALKQLRKLDNNSQNIILKYLRSRIGTPENPKRFGKALIGDMKGLWRYRVDNYRIICRLEEDILTVLVVKIGHRRNIYD